MTTTISPMPTASRLPRIDMLRGIAVLAMIIYHFAWDLTFFGLIETNVAAHPLWSRFAMLIAASFLLLSGVSLELSARTGLNWRKFNKRLLILIGAAALVSIGTYLATPTSFVFFGILHSLALGSILALPFLRMPTMFIAGVAALVFAMPWLSLHAAFNHPALLWVGLGTVAPDTSDYVPLFPWFAFMLFGVMLARFLSMPPATSASNSKNFLGVIGRHSLPIYLIHQPILMALIGAASLILPLAGEQKFVDEFRTSCQDNCQLTQSAAEICPRFCSCIEDKLKSQKLWKPLLRNRLSNEQEASVSQLSNQCATAAR
jgi:uncharacterized membrane protein